MKKIAISIILFSLLISCGREKHTKSIGGMIDPLAPKEVGSIVYSDVVWTVKSNKSKNTLNVRGRHVFNEVKFIYFKYPRKIKTLREMDREYLMESLLIDSFWVEIPSSQKIIPSEYRMKTQEELLMILECDAPENSILAMVFSYGSSPYGILNFGTKLGGKYKVVSHETKSILNVDYYRVNINDKKNHSHLLNNQEIVFFQTGKKSTKEKFGQSYDQLKDLKIIDCIMQSEYSNDLDSRKYTAPIYAVSFNVIKDSKNVRLTCKADVLVKESNIKQNDDPELNKKESKDKLIIKQ